ncbi:hypothetical protein QZH41_001665 [Actinostola sp. cb2023]|nr:hypothetical protein QZH41_001665 [Actinostola sp. cb2023]
MRDRQVSWLPCEVEALAIAVATKHFSPYIIQSRHKVSILTDSKPCVQAFEKLCRGEFSASPRVSTFLSTVSRYQATVQHVAGAAILPSDFASRDAPDCNDMSCQVCSFIKQTEDSVIGHLSVEDILKGTSKLPFTSRAAWQSMQAECADLRRTQAHLTQGIRPSKKLTNIKDIKRYSSIATIASDGLLIVQGNEPLSPPRQRIVVPRQVLEGLLTALHIKLEHPSRHQLRSAANHHFFALDMDKAIDHVTKSCHPCAALKKTRGLSAREMWMQRDQFSNHQVALSDQELVHKQHDLRNANHPYSEKSKAPLKKAIDAPQVKIGDLVYLYSDRNTSCSRDRYLVTSTEGVWCNIRKFTGPQHRKTSYCVKSGKCYKVPNHMSLNRSSYRTPQHDSSGARQSPPEPPEVPRGISTPPTPHSYIPTDNFHELVATPPATVDNEDHLNNITDNQSPRSRTYLDNQLLMVSGVNGDNGAHVTIDRRFTGSTKRQASCEADKLLAAQKYIVNGQWGKWGQWSSCHHRLTVNSATALTWKRFLATLSDVKPHYPDTCWIDNFNVPQHCSKIFVTDVAQVCMHPQYAHRTLDYDIALLRLAHPIMTFNEHIKHVCLPTNSYVIPIGNNCTVTGFGRVGENADLSSKLRQATVPIKQLNYCRTQYPAKLVTSRMICAGYEGGQIDSCKGDSGGPFVCKDKFKFTLTGAVSWGVGCARAGQPGLYTNIKYFLPWIQNTIKYN